jgi:hypothetical protein
MRIDFGYHQTESQRPAAIAASLVAAALMLGLSLFAPRQAAPDQTAAPSAGERSADSSPDHALNRLNGVVHHG